MKHLKHLFTTLFLLCTTVATAHNFEVSGIYYNITDESNKTVAVTYRGIYSSEYSGEYTGDVVIPESVTYDGNTYSVTSIGDYAFYGCSEIKRFTIPNSVTSIGSSAFRDCSGLTSIVIPNSVTSIGDYTFCSCDRLTSVTIGNSVTSIGWCAFEDCSGLTSIEIPNSVTSIGYEAFCNCNGLTSIEIPNSVTIIGDYAFSGCSGLTSIEIPNSVTSIGDGAFRDCSGLTSIEIPNSVTSIEEDAFYNCSGLKKVELNCATIGSWFSGNESIEEVVIGNSVTSIGSSAFFGCSRLTSIEIPNSVTSIGDCAFSGCSGLKRIAIPDSIPYVGSGAFYGTEWLGSRPDGVLYIGKALYEYIGTMPSNTSIEVKEGTTQICGSAFSDCSGLARIVIPNSVTSIDAYAFYCCSGLTSIEIPNSVTSIGYAAFRFCSGLTSVVIGNGVTSIGIYAFCNCRGLTSVTIGNSVTSIGDEAFNGCSGLKTVVNFSNLTFKKGSSDNGHVAYYADKVVNAPNGEMVGDYGFYTVDGVNYLGGYIGDDTELVLPQNYKGKNYFIGDYAFYRSYDLASVDIPNGVMGIGDYVFYNCTSLNSVTIPESITSIGEGAFESCTALARIRSLIPVDKLFVPGDYAFNEVDEASCVLYVPEGAVSAYQSTDGWNEFENIVDFDPDFTVTYIVDGEEYETMTVEYGKEIPLPATPEKEGHTFSGWSEIPATMPAEDITIEGSFTINHYAVTYIVDGEVYLTDSVVYGGEIVLINEPAKEYYTFSGWSEVPATMPAEDVTVYGSFIANSYFLTSIVDGELDYYNLEEEKNVDNFAYYRTLPDTKWNSLYVPFDIAVEDIANDYDVAYINCVHSYDRDKNGEIDEMEMEVILVLDGVLKANYPYLIRAKNEEKMDIALCLENTTLYAAEENCVTCSSVFTRFDVVGNYTTQPVQETAGCYEVRDGMWQALNPGAELQPFRHYLYITNIDGSPLKENVVRSMSIRVDGEVEDDDETTGIDELQSADNKGSYDLQGRKINEITEKGIYIVNGKKVLVK